MKDLIIIGAGPAGLSAAIYGKRAGLDLLLLERLAPGGQVMNTAEVENYPGFVEPIAGWELVAAFENQARRMDTEIVSASIVSFERSNGHDSFIIKADNNENWESKAVIAAMGSSYRKLGVPGEADLIGKGVSYCATCDGAFFKDKVTAVVGGGDTALEEALFLTKFASKVYLVHRRYELRESKILQERVKSNPQITPIFNSTVVSINGEQSVRSLTVFNKETQKEGELKVDGVFIFVGYDPNSQIIPSDILNDRRQVQVDMHMRTPVPGLFAAGDIREDSRRQIVMAAADGATAAMSAYEYITHFEL